MVRVDGPDSLGEWLARACGPGPLAEGDVAEARRRLNEDPVTAEFRRLGVDLESRAGGRLELFRRVADLCPRLTLDVAGHEVEARVSLSELWRFYLPICQALTDVMPCRDRLLVGLAGPGASGKSVFAALLREAINRGLSEQGARAALCPMDGFHYPNAYLDSHFVVDDAGHRVPLRAFKGAPQTFDAEAFLDCLRRLKVDRFVTVPRYDRQLHDPVPDGLRIGPEEQAVLVEGNFLLLDRGAFAAVADMLDLSLFLVQPFEVIREAMIGRHVLGGRSDDDAAAHFERVDRKNYEICMRTARRADLIVRRDAGQHVVGLEAGPKHGGAPAQ